jgi:ubiquinone/menaquinone biosynthesis C-methylase UbiE
MLGRGRHVGTHTYDRLSGCYDLISKSEYRCVSEGIRMLGARGGDRILEIGFGTGNALIDIAELIGTGVVVGVDASRGMYRQAEKRIANAGRSDRIELILGDARELPVGLPQFDAVFMSFTFELFDRPDRRRVLGECCRVLREGGRICIVGMARRNRRGPMVRLYELAHSMAPEVTDCRPIPIGREIDDAGYTIVETRRMSVWGLPVDAVLAAF